MKSFALLCKRTGELVEAHPIGILDFINGSIIQEMGVFMCRHSGWLIYHPDTGLWRYFMNKEFVSDRFENLGEI